MKLSVGDAKENELWLEKINKKRMSFINLKPIGWGKGTEKTSKEIDKILYRE